jgi:far upstream element-binding protein
MSCVWFSHHCFVSHPATPAQVLEEAVQPGEGEVEERVSCPSTLVGRIIGRGGETIRSLQGGSGAHILVDQNYPEGADR